MDVGSGVVGGSGWRVPRLCPVEKRSFTMLNRPSLRSIPTASELDEEMFYPPAHPKCPAGFGRRLWKGWLWLTSPRPGYFSPDLVGQEYQRRSQMVSVLLLLVVAAILILIPDVFIQPRLACCKRCMRVWRMATTRRE
jgi:hypothetical protein